MPRNRERSPLEDRLKFAKEARTAATLVAPGRNHDELLRKKGSQGCTVSTCDRQSVLIRASRSSVHYCTDALIRRRLAVCVSAPKISYRAPGQRPGVRLGKETAPAGGWTGAVIPMRRAAGAVSNTLGGRPFPSLLSQSTAVHRRRACRSASRPTLPRNRPNLNRPFRGHPQWQGPARLKRGRPLIFPR